MTEKAESLKTIIAYLLRYRRRLILGIIFLFITTGFALTIPLFIKSIIESIRDPSNYHHLFKYIIALILAAIFQATFRIFSRITIFGLSRQIEFDLRNEIFHHLLRLPYAFFLNRSTGDIVSRCTNDLNSVRMLLGPGILNVINTSIIYFSSIILMFYIDPILTLCALMPYPFLFLIVKQFGRWLFQGFQRAQAQLSSISTKIQENLAGIPLIQAYTMEDKEIEDFKSLNREYQNINIQLVKIRGFLLPFVGIAGGLGTLIVLWVGGREVISGEISLGDFVAFNSYLALLLWPTIALGWVMNLFQGGLSAMGRIKELLAVKPGGDGAASELNPRCSEVRLEKLSFSYPSENGNLQPVLKDITIKFSRGMIGIVGPTGSGKTTLVNIITKFLETEKGMVYIDGMDIKDISSRSLRKNIGYVPQESFLFSSTIRENVAFGKPDASQEEIEEALASSHILEEVKEFPQGLDTLVGQRGMTLSGGQRQRLALARALLTKAPILILDDTLSSVDLETERMILERLKDIKNDQLIILISHRINAIKEADLILVLKDGRIVEKGVHEELISKKGLYHQMYVRQRLEEELERL